MGSVGEYWREHREYVERKKYGKTKRKVEYQCSCGKKYYSIFDAAKMRQHLKDKPEHTLISGDVTDYSKQEFELTL